MRLPDFAVRNLAVGSGPSKVFVATLKGFGVRVSPKSKTFVLVIHRGNRNKWETLGKYPVVSLAQAREEARNRLSAVQLGIKPEPPAMTFEETYSLFLTSYKAKNRVKTIYEMERLVKRHLMPRFKATPVGDISTNELASIIDRLLSTPAECKALFTAARTIFRWIAKRRLVAISPMSGLDTPTRLVSRDRVLADDELGTVLRQAIAEASTFGRIVEMLIRTGQRVKQISHLRVEWIDYQARTITWPREVMKGNREHTIPYSDAVATMLDSLPKHGFLFPARGRDTPFNGFSKTKEAFDGKLDGIEPYTLHDLRRSLASGWQRIGVPVEVTEAMLAHRSGTFQGIVSVYQRHNYLPELRAAVQKWNDYLQALLPTTEGTNG